MQTEMITTVQLWGIDSSVTEVSFVKAINFAILMKVNFILGVGRSSAQCK